MKRIAKVFTGLMLALLFSLAGLVSWGGPLADIRPDVVTDAAQPDREAKGRELLQAALTAHGGADGYTRHDTRSFTVEDEWVGALFQLFNPWPDATVHAQVVQRIHSFDSQVTFIGGELPGQTWGISDGRAWERSGEAAPVAVESPDLSFMLPTLHYFMEFPLRLPEAEIVRYVGTQTIDGTDYEVVYLTWQSVQANPDYDQYLVYIDPTTQRIAKVFYTVRDAMKMATGTAHLLDQQLIGGVWTATRVPVTTSPSDDTSTYLHEFRFSDFSFDTDQIVGP